MASSSGAVRARPVSRGPFTKGPRTTKSFEVFFSFLPLSHFDESGRGLRISNDVRVHRKGVGVLIEKRKGESEYHRDRLDR